MEPLEKDFEFPRGDTFPLKWKLTDAIKNILTPTGDFELYFTLKKNYNTGNVIIQKRLSLDEIKYDETDSVYYTILEHEDTATLNYGKFVYDIQVKTNQGYVKTLARGEITLTNESTHIANE
jgi:hypothetical protein